MHLAWKSILLIVGGTLLLRLAGRKSISQMTLAQTVIMIGIGSLLIQPVSGENVWVTLGIGLVLVLSLIAMEYLELKFDWFEKFITGTSKTVIENGQLQIQTLKRLRLTVDLLETQLREKSISSINDVEYATLEPNGQLGFVLKEDAQPVTKKEFKQLMNELGALQAMLQPQSPQSKPDLFTEVRNRGHVDSPNSQLQ